MGGFVNMSSPPPLISVPTSDSHHHIGHQQQHLPDVCVPVTNGASTIQAPGEMVLRQPTIGCHQPMVMSPPSSPSNTMDSYNMTNLPSTIA